MKADTTLLLCHVSEPDRVIMYTMNAMNEDIARIELFRISRERRVVRENSDNDRTDLSPGTMTGRSGLTGSSPLQVSSRDFKISINYHQGTEAIKPAFAH